MRVSLSYDLLRVSSCQTILITRTAMSRTPQHTNTTHTKQQQQQSTHNAMSTTTKSIAGLIPSTPTFTNPALSTDTTQRQTHTMCLHVPINSVYGFFFIFLVALHQQHFIQCIHSSGRFLSPVSSHHPPHFLPSFLIS